MSGIHLLASIIGSGVASSHAAADLGAGFPHFNPQPGSLIRVALDSWQLRAATPTQIDSRFFTSVAWESFGSSATPAWPSSIVNPSLGLLGKGVNNPSGLLVVGGGASGLGWLDNPFEMVVSNSPLRVRGEGWTVPPMGPETMIPLPNPLALGVGGIGLLIGISGRRRINGRL